MPEIEGINGILDTYKKNIKDIHMAGPTFFSSIMDIFMDFAVEGRDLKTYFILLILTDGEIHDMNETKKMIIEASKLPCSIIIVGIGDEDFDMMIELDSDDKALKDDKNNEAKRDIVQFVKYDQSIEMGNLAVEVLKEIPAQVCRYMEMIGYEPKKIQADMDKIEQGIEKQKEAILEKLQRQNPGDGALRGPGPKQEATREPPDEAGNRDEDRYEPYKTEDTGLGKQEKKKKKKKKKPQAPANDSNEIEEDQVG